jgi:hypothetical protein
LPEIFRFLADDPMPTVYIGHLESGKEPPNGGYGLITDVVTLGSSYEERRLVKSSLIRVGEWKISHVIESLRQYPDRDPEFHRISGRRSNEVRHEKLTYWEVLFKVRLDWSRDHACPFSK